MLDQEPLSLSHTHKHPRAAKLFPVEGEFEIALRQRAIDIFHFGLPRAAIPDHDGPASILSFRDHAFELEIIDRMIFGLESGPRLTFREREILRDRPRLQDAVDLEAEVPVERRRVVLLDDEAPQASTPV